MSVDYKKLLKDYSFKVTPSRVAILEVFSKYCKPQNAEEIFKKVKKVADQVTVYRTLNSFEEKGILKRIDLRKGSVYYELNNDNHHHHMVCTDCGLIEDFEQCTISSLAEKALTTSSRFAFIAEHSVELFGMCKTCVKSH